MQNLSVPFRIGPTGGVAVISTDAAVIGQRVLDFMATNHGERVMLPLYGAHLASLIFENVDDPFVLDTLNDVQVRLSQAVPEANIVGITATADDGGPSQLNIEVSYTVRPFTDVRSVTTVLTGIVTQETGF